MCRHNGGEQGAVPVRLIVRRVRPTPGSQLARAASGKVYFEMAGTGYVCSGSVATDSRSDKSLVLTAGHCAYDETNGAFATNWLFIPDFDSNPSFTCPSTKYGCWTAEALAVHAGYAAAGGFNTQATVHDFAFAVVGAGGKSASDALQLDATVGSAFAFVIEQLGLPHPS